MTGKIFLKLIAGVFCLLLLALVTVDYFATNVAKDNYIQNLTGQLADKGRMLALTFGTGETLDAANVPALTGTDPLLLMERDPASAHEFVVRWPDQPVASVVGGKFSFA